MLPIIVYAKKNTAFTLDVGLISQADTTTLQANPTIAAGDFKVSTDESAFGNLATLPTVSPAAGKNVKVPLSAGEMNGDRVVILGSDAAGAEWCDIHILILTTPVDADVTKFGGTAGTFAAGRPEVNTTHAAGTAWGAGAITAASIADGAFVAAKFAAASLNGKGDWLTAAGYTAPDNASIATILARCDVATSTRFAAASYVAPDNATIAAIFARTDVATSTRAVAGDAMTLTAAERNAVADALLARSLDGAGASGRTVRQALAVLRNKVVVAAGVLTVYAEDDVTPLFTANVTTAAGNPISAIDPT